jgi:tetratricopeptide (TPR) repeat protein
MQLLEQAGEDYIALANAYFTIAMLRLADGNETEAIEYFEKCVATNATGFFDCEWARAYLSRMKSGAIDK